MAKCCFYPQGLIWNERTQKDHVVLCRLNAVCVGSSSTAQFHTEVSSVNQKMSRIWCETTTAPTHTGHNTTTNTCLTKTAAQFMRCKQWQTDIFTYTPHTSLYFWKSLMDDVHCDGWKGKITQKGKHTIIISFMIIQSMKPLYKIHY